MCWAAARSCNLATRRSRSSSRSAATRILAAPLELARNAAMSTIIKQEAAPYLEAFQSRESDAPEPNWLRDRRTRALSHFASLGFPTRPAETRACTNLARL